MSRLARRQYLIAIVERYQKAKKGEKGMILNEFCAVCGYSRKYAIRILNHHPPVRGKKPGRAPRYEGDVVKHLTALWYATGRICSKRFQKALPEWIKYYSPIDSETEGLLLKISPATIDRLLKPERKKQGLSTTKPAKYWYKSRIAIQPDEFGMKEPGFITADTVAHCGESAAGPFVNTITVTDLASTWTVNRAIWTKNQEEVKQGLSCLESRLAFSIKSFKSDSGSEFINKHMYDFFNQRNRPVVFFRTRPYHKNDNCHVEQKNFTHVRTLFGYARIDDQELVVLMNEIYELYWNPLQNFFLPTIKLVEKKRIGVKVKRFYEEPKTPFERLVNSEYISDEQKRSLREQKSKLNPFHLRLELEIKIKEFWEIQMQRRASSKAA
jgi:hypothetical protein